MHRQPVRLVTDVRITTTDALPRHLLIAVDAAGEGPVDPDAPEFDHWTCWCLASRRRPARIKWNSGNGLTLCPATDLPIYHGFPPGWKPGPAA